MRARGWPKVVVGALLLGSVALPSRIDAVARTPAPAGGTANVSRTGASQASAQAVSRGPAGPVKRVETTVAAVGDIACVPGSSVTLLSCRHQQVSDMILADPSIDWFLALGDLQYNSGELANFNASYDPTYGRFKSKTYPSPGNHEYNTANGAGYYAYFGSAAHPPSGWYRVDLSPSWELLVLNSNCGSVGGCNVGSPQHTWLGAQLSSITKPCVVATWHHPLFTSSARGPVPEVRPLWDLLTDARAELVLNGHDHFYERFSRQRGDGTADVTAPREFVVGTGGVNTYGTSTPIANSAARSAGFGYLRLTLWNGAYDWEFVGEPATTTFTDTGSRECTY